MASKDVVHAEVEGGDGDAELVLAMVTSPSLSSNDAGAILLGVCCISCPNNLLYQSLSSLLCTCTYTGAGATTVPDDESVGKELVDPRAVRRHNDPMDLVELAHTVQQADKFLRATTGGKLQVIVDQIRFLQQQVSFIHSSVFNNWCIINNKFGYRDSVPLSSHYPEIFLGS